MTRRLATALVLAFALLAGAAPATALAQDNSAVAVNTKDDSSVFELAFEVKKVSGEVVDQTNQAVAYSSCERCQTVAIAIQVVLVMTESPDVVTPVNVAVAVNEECSLCTTMALAYQFVVGTGGPVELTRDGRRQIERIRRELRRLGRSGVSAAEIRDRTAALVDELRTVLATELVPVRRGRDDDDDNRGRSFGDEGDESDADADADQGEEPSERAPPEPLPPETTPTETAPTETTPEAPPEQPTTPETVPEEQPAPEDGATQTTP